MRPATMAKPGGKLLVTSWGQFHCHIVHQLCPNWEVKGTVEQWHISSGMVIPGTHIIDA